MSTLEWPSPTYNHIIGSFECETIVNRVPTIIVSVINDILMEQKRFTSLIYTKDEVSSECKSIIGKLSQLRYEMMTDKKMRPIDDKCNDVNEWNSYLKIMDEALNTAPESIRNRKPICVQSLENPDPVHDSCNADQTTTIETKLSWFSTTFLFAECYTYRRILEAFHQSYIFKNYDPFAHSKQSAWQNVEDAAKKLLSNYMNLLNSDQVSSSYVIQSLLRVCTWGNKFDLSLSASRPVDHNPANCESHTDIMEIPSNDYMLVDDTEELVNFILKSTRLHLDFIADNSGLELLVDLVLIHFLLKRKLIASAELHLKEWPWFVSDATKDDYLWLVHTISTEKYCCVNSGFSLSSDLRSFMASGFFKVSEHNCWNSAIPYSRMTKKSNDFKRIMDNDNNLIIIKGDLNYRRFTGDLQYIGDKSPTFAQYKNVAFPRKSVCALRTLKSNTCSRLPSERVEKARFLSNNEDVWLTNGNFAVIQFSR